MSNDNIHKALMKMNPDLLRKLVKEYQYLANVLLKLYNAPLNNATIKITVDNPAAGDLQLTFVEFDIYCNADTETIDGFKEFIQLECERMVRRRMLCEMALEQLMKRPPETVGKL